MSGNARDYCCCFFSDTVTSQLNSSINMQVGILRCCSKSSCVQKNTVKDTKFAELSWKYIPLVVTSYDARGFKKQVVTHLAIHRITSKSAAFASLYMVSSVIPKLEQKLVPI